MTELQQKISDIIVERLGIKESKIKPEASFVDDLGANSLDLVELIMELENSFSIIISDEDADKLKTVGDVFTYIEKVTTEK
jgi:acyl carrier protein